MEIRRDVVDLRMPAAPDVCQSTRDGFDYDARGEARIVARRRFPLQIVQSASLVRVHAEWDHERLTIGSTVPTVSA